MDQNEPQHQPGGFRGKGVAFQHQRGGQKNQAVPEYGSGQGNPQKFSHIIFRRPGVPAAHAAADDRHKRQPHGRTHQRGHRPETLGHAVGRDLHRPEQGGNTAERHLHQLEQSVLDAVGNGNSQDPPDHAALPAQNLVPTQKHGIFLPEAKGQDHQRRKGSGNQRRIRHAGHTGMQHKYAHRVSRDIDDIGRRRQIHGHAGFSHAPVDGRSRIVQGDGRIGIGGDPQIRLTGLHHRRLHLAEQKPQQMPVQRQHRQHHPQGKYQGNHHQLAGGKTSVFAVPASDILADHHRASRGQGRKQKNKHGVEHIYQGYPRHCRFPRVADHKGIRHAHQHLQQLFKK